MTPENTLLLCLLAPFIGALGCLAFGTKLKAAGVIAILASTVSLTAAIFLVCDTADGSVIAVHSGNWPAPYGIVLVVDGFSALMLAVCQLVVLAAIFYGSVSLPVRLKRRHLYPLTLTLSFGTNGAFLTGDLFNLYVWFEVLLLSSFSLMAALKGSKAQTATWRYVVINLVSSLLFLVAAGLVYGKTGTLNFADLHIIIRNTESPFLIDSSAALLLGAFGIKAALIPLAFWLPASYPHLPPALSALFAGLLTKVGLYAMYRVFV
ncbi:MAG: complex I subunit 5 family protein, partial [Akkermansiaceae bacterium]